MDNTSTTEPQLDSGSFLTGFLKTFLASSGSGGNGMVSRLECDFLVMEM